MNPTIHVQIVAGQPIGMERSISAKRRHYPKLNKKCRRMWSEKDRVRKVDDLGVTEERRRKKRLEIASEVLKKQMKKKKRKGMSLAKFKRLLRK